MDTLDRLLVIPLGLIVLFVLGALIALVSQVSGTEALAALGSAETLFALRLSLACSVTAVIIAALLGVPAAYLLARRTFRGKGVLDTLLDVPLVMPPLVAGVGLLFLLGRGMLGGPLAELGIRLVLSPWGAVVAQTFVATPIVIRSAKAAFESLDPGYEAAGMTLGLSPWKVFVKINLPLAWRSVASGIILAWARALGEFGATLMMAGATRFHTETLPIAVYLNISSGEVGIAVSCALVLVGTAFLLLLALRLIGPNRAAGL